MKVKYALYQEAGVTEYWLVDPIHIVIMQLVLDEMGRYQLKKIAMDEDNITPHLFPELVVNAAEVFESWQDQQD